MSFKTRSYTKELLDRSDIPFADIKRNMQELDTINHYLGGHRITLKGVSSLAENARQPLHILEIGCGDGNNLRVIESWARKKGFSISLTGVDINSECIFFAREQPSNKNISFICADYKEAQLSKVPDVIFSSLFCHHFTDDQLVIMLQWMHRNSKAGFFINDLHRHPLAYYSIKWLTKAFSKSYLVKNDAPLSVKRGFKKIEWQRLMQTAGIEKYQCSWQWAFRWLIMCRK